MAFFNFRKLWWIPGNFRVHSRKFIFELWKHCWNVLSPKGNYQILHCIFKKCLFTCQCISYWLMQWTNSTKGSLLLPKICGDNYTNDYWKVNTHVVTWANQTDCYYMYNHSVHNGGNMYACVMISYLTNVKTMYLSVLLLPIFKQSAIRQRHALCNPTIS